MARFVYYILIRVVNLAISKYKKCAQFRLNNTSLYNQIFKDLFLKINFFTEMSLALAQGHFSENGDSKGLFCKNYYKKGNFGEKC